MISSIQCADKSIIMKSIGILTAFTLSTRFYNLSVPSSVCWDETHFGKMAGLYLNRTYFMDVHPPFGKVLIALAGLMTGFDGKFQFMNPGDEYVNENEDTHYYGMRAFSAICGSLVVPLLHCTVKTMTGSNGAALITSLLLIFDCGFITLSQYILLDPILLFFMAATLFCTTKYSEKKDSHQNKTMYKMQLMISYVQKHNLSFIDDKMKSSSKLKSFSSHWWVFLTLSGLCLGCMLAVKWIGLFTVIFVGCWTVNDLWDLLRNIKEISMIEFMKHFLSRLLCLIIVPGCVYAALFVIHYQILDKSGQTDGYHSSTFQSCLKGNPLYNASMPLHMAYGSIISLKHHRTSASGLLHSHDRVYPMEVMPFPHQQVTLYFHKDQNNLWEVVKPNGKDLIVFLQNVSDNILHHDGEESNEVEFLKDNSVFRLRHVRTKHYLHSHPRPAPVSTQQRIVSGHNYSNEEGKLNELWKLQLVWSNENDDRIRVMTSQFRLVHVYSGCMLQNSLKILPDWGDKRYEVTCSHHRRDRSTALWNIEQHFHQHLPDSYSPSCQMTFWERFLESHLVMAAFNSQLKATPGERVSKPWHWPLNYKGQVFTRMGEGDLRVYLLGNPLVFWLNLMIIVLSPFIIVVTRIAELREISRSKTNPKPLSLKLKEEQERLERVMESDFESMKQFYSTHHLLACKWFLVGWAVHYLPFILMSRILYFHHYYPAFLFSCCLSGCFLDIIFKNCSIFISRLLHYSITSHVINFFINFLFTSLVMHSFYLYLPLCYGMTGPFSHEKDSMMYGLKLFSQWEI